MSKSTIMHPFMKWSQDKKNLTIIIDARDLKNEKMPFYWLVRQGNNSDNNNTLLLLPLLLLWQ